MKKRLLSIFLCTVMICSMVPTLAMAANLPFTDVKTNSWYYEDVKIAYEGNLINGKTATIFDPNANLTYAEAVKLAACMHQKNMTGNVTLTNGNPWYQSYVDYCKTNGIINKDYSWNTNATRAGYMEIFANALPDYSLKAINTVDNGAIPDVPMTHPQSAAIYKLYRAGIVQGVDSKYNCNPSSNIKRSEVAAILTRMMNTNKRVSFSLTNNNNVNPGEEVNALSVSIPSTASKTYGETGVTLTATVKGGKAPYTYAWYYKSPTGSSYEKSGSTLQTYPLGPNIAVGTWSFYCEVTDSNGKTAKSNYCTATVKPAEEELSVSIPSTASQIYDETRGSMTATVQGGKAPYKYAWYYKAPGSSSYEKSGDTNQTYVAGLTIAVGEWSFYCEVTDSNGKTAKSNYCTFTVNP